MKKGQRADPVLSALMLVMDLVAGFLSGLGIRKDIQFREASP